MSKSTLTSVCLALVLVGCGPPWGPPPEAAELVEADRLFYEDTKARGAEGWASWFEENGRMYREVGYVDGRAAIQAAMDRTFSTPGLELRWAADTVFVAAAGDLGYTLGHWELIVRSEVGDSVAGRGNYVTIWRRQSDGSWKVAADIGNQAEREE
jgi:ketosteroid isomerase-like protein